MSAACDAGKNTVIGMAQTSANTRSLAKKVAIGSAGTVSWVFRKAVKLILIALFIAAGFFIGGFLQFSDKVTGYTTPANMEAADAIVVLTGGSTRIENALKLLAQKKGKRLLITGVNTATKMQDIRARSSVDPNLFNCCVDLESLAVDTIGNAEQTARWVEQFGYGSLIVVTSAYHMPRSMLEFRRQMPSITMTAYPVLLQSINREGWWKNPETLRFLLAEYIKYIGAKSRDYVNSQTLQALRSSMMPK